MNTDDQGHFLQIDINIENRNFCLANAYRPNVHNPYQLQIISTQIMTDIILGGDLMISI